MSAVARRLSARSSAERPPKVRLLTRNALDGRTRASKLFEAIVGGIHTDLGGSDNLSTVEIELAEAFAGAAVNVRDLNARLLLGQNIDLAEQVSAISALVRVASRLGTGRRAKDVTPTLNEYLRGDTDNGGGNK